MPAVLGVVETSLYVDDLETSLSFYVELFGFPVIYREGQRMCGLGVAGKQVLLLFHKGGSLTATIAPGGRIPPHDGQGSLHVAFAVEKAELAGWREKLKERGIEIESEVDCGRGGHSIYFRDPDRHLLELISPGCWPVF